MAAPDATVLPTGMAGLAYPITQVSLVVADMDPLLERYHRTFGWAPWQDFDHVPPSHHDTMYKGRDVEYTLRGAEVMVGSLNFELLQPGAGGDSLFHDHLARRGESIASIASMFHERRDGDAVKAAFKEQFDLDVINRAEIGDHIEYYYIDTQEAFGCPIESGSGHAIDFTGPARVYPEPGAEPGPSPDSGIRYGISQVTLVVRDLRTAVSNFHRAFGWGPWKLFRTDGTSDIEDVALGGAPAEFEATFAQTVVGDINFEVVQPRGGHSPWQSFLEESGEGLMGITVQPQDSVTLDEVSAQFNDAGIDEQASARVGDSEWRLFDTQASFKTHIAASTGLAYATAHPDEELFAA